ncbi:MAG: nitrate reductase, partial [Chitinispirillia bacterium]
LPFTYMMHFVAKYFTYHEIRWNDEPIEPGSPLEKKIEKLMGQKVTWSAPHIRGEGKKTWVDIATEEVKNDKKN